VRENAYHLVIGLVWLAVTVVAILVYIADGNVLRRRKKDLQVINVLALNDTNELLTKMHCGGGAEGAGLPPGAIVSKDISNMRFQPDPNLKPTEIQPPTTEQRTPLVLARKPATRARLRQALRKGGTIALNGGLLVRLLLKNSGFLIKSSLPDKRISLAIALLITFCSGFAAALAWQSSRQTAPVPQTTAAPVALSPSLEQQLEAMSSSLAAVRQSVDELSDGLGQMRRHITNLQTTEQALFDKISEPPPRPAAVPPARSTPRPPQAPTSAR
jgi:uncharacterized coiled-coil protein SlyX